MTISVVIPAYNRAGLLPATLRAVLDQTRPPDEVIVVDDGSSDDTAAVARAFDPGIRCIIQPNSGDLAARNTGIAAATGRLVAFCDSDDLWRPEFLAAMASIWDAEPMTNVAWCDFVLVRDDVWGTETKFQGAPEGYWNGLRSISRGLSVFDSPAVAQAIRFQPFFPSCAVATRGFLRTVGGWDESVGRTVGTDLATTLAWLEHPPVGVMFRPLVGIRRHAGNYSGDTQAMNLGDATILEHVLARRPSLAPLASTIRASVARRRSEALDIAFARRDFDGVVRISGMVAPTGAGSRLKRLIALWPEPLRTMTARLFLGLGSMRAGLSWKR